MKKLQLVACFLALSALSPGLALAEDLVVLVNADNPATSISRRELNDYFFKKRRQWPDGTNVRFIDGAPNSSDRRLFLSSVLKKTDDEVSLYWIGQKLYSGDSAPIQDSSENMRVQFVANFRGAIGYVPASYPVNERGVKVLKISDTAAN